MSTVIVLNYNDAETVENYLDYIQDYSCFEHIVVVDNHSTDDSYQRLLKRKKGIIDVIQSDKNGGYGYGNNYGVKYAVEKYGAEYMLISNPDVKYTENGITEMENILKTNLTVGVVAMRMRNVDGTLSIFSAWKIPTLLQKVFINCLHPNKMSLLIGRREYPESYFTSKNQVEVDCVPGSLLMVNAQYFIECGMYDERIFLYGEETALGFRMKRYGYKSFLLTDKSFLHEHSVSISKSIKTKTARLATMWKSRMYILEQYYEINSFQKLFIEVYAKFNIWQHERRFKKHLKSKESK